MKLTRNRSWRSIISLALGIALLLGSLPAYKARAAEQAFDWTLESGQVKANKTVTALGDDTFEVKLEAAGKPFDTTTANKLDVVLIIDKSTSMNSSNKLTNAKNAAGTAVKALLEINTTTGQTYNRVAILPFGTTAENVTTWHDNVTNAQAAVNAVAINGTQYTNIQDAFRKAQTLLGTRRADVQPVVILLSDGDPTLYYNGLTSTSVSQDTNSGPEYVYWTVQQGWDLKDTIKNNLKIYTIGLGVGPDSYAVATLDPSEPAFYNMPQRSNNNSSVASSTGVIWDYIGQKRTKSGSSWSAWQTNYKSATQVTSNPSNTEHRYANASGGVDAWTRNNTVTSGDQNASGFTSSASNGRLKKVPRFADYVDQYYNVTDSSSLTALYASLINMVTGGGLIDGPLTMTDVIGEGFELVSNSPSITGEKVVWDGSKVTWTITGQELSAEQRPTLTFRVKRTATVPGTYYTNTETTDSTGNNKAVFTPVAENKFYGDTPSLQTLYLTAAKSAQVVPVAVDDSQHYLASQIGNGYDETALLLVNDSIIAGRKIIGLNGSASTAQVMEGGKVIADVALVDGKVTVTPRAGGTGTFTYTLQVPAKQSRTVDPATMTVTATVTITVDKAPSIKLDKTVVGSTTLQDGAPASYQLVITNNGDHDLTDVYFTDDQLAPGTAVSGATYTKDGEVHKWVIGNLAKGETKTFTYTVAYESAGSKTNTATAYGTGSGVTVSSTDNKTVTVLTPAALSVEKTVALWDGNGSVGGFFSGLRITPTALDPVSAPAALAAPADAVDPAAKLKQLQDAVDAKQAVVDGLEADLAAAQAALAALMNGDTATLQAAVDAAKAAEETAKAAMDASKDAKDAAVNAQTAAEQAKNDAQAQLDAAQAELTAAQAALAAADPEDEGYAALEQAVTAAQASVATAQTAYDAANTAYNPNAADAAIAQYESDIKAWEAASKVLADATAALAGGANNTVAIAAKNTEIATIESNLAAAKTELDAAKAALEAFILANPDIGDVTATQNSVIFKIVITNDGESDGTANFSDAFDGIITKWLDSGFADTTQPTSVTVPGSGSIIYYAVVENLLEGTYVNTATISKGQWTDADSATVVVGAAPAPLFEITKKVNNKDADTIFEDEKATFVITVTNSGDAPGEFSLTDLLNGTDITGVLAGGTHTLAPKASTTFTYVMDGSTSKLDAGVYSNRAILNHGNTVIEAGATLLVLPRTPEVGIAKEVREGDGWAKSTTIYTEEHAKFRVIITNTGTGDAAVTLSDILDRNTIEPVLLSAGLALAPTSTSLLGGATLTDGNYFLPRYTGRVELIYDVTFDQAGSYINTAAVTGEGIEKSDTAAVNVLERESGVHITKTVNKDTVMVGESATFTITIWNDGNGDAMEIGLTDIMEQTIGTGGALAQINDWTDFTTVTPEGGAIDYEDGLFFGLPRHGGKLTLTFTHTFTAAGTYVNTASIGEGEGESDSATVTVTQRPTEPTPTPTNPTTPPTNPTPTPPAIIPYTPAPSPTLPPTEEIDEGEIPLGPGATPAPTPSEVELDDDDIPLNHPKTGDAGNGLFLWMLFGSVAMFILAAVLWHKDGKRSRQRK